MKAVRVGIVGFGFMGRQHLHCYRGLRGVRVAAICDSDRARLKGSEKIEGNIGDDDAALDLSDVALYADFEKMLAEQKLDAISITLPTFMHRDFTVKTLDAGAHVLCEKPMAMNVEQCEDMIAAAKTNKRILQIGHCIRFWPEYVKAKQIVDSGKYGDVLAASFRRVSTVPEWSWKNWLIHAKQSGGAIMDLHIHDADYIQYMFRLPEAVRSEGAIGPSGGFDYVTTQYVYKNGKVVSAEGGFVMSPDFKFEMSFVISLKKATISYDCRRTPTLQVCLAGGGCVTPKIESGDGWSREIAHFIKKVKGTKVPRIISPADSLNAVKIILAEKQSAESKKEVAIR
ncbi:MAG: Gfo/Idh/MocA family oxidoreductase [Sedimentisphaerales bacterium]